MPAVTRSRTVTWPTSRDASPTSPTPSGSPSPSPSASQSPGGDRDPANLLVTPEESTGSTGGSATFTATVTDADGRPIQTVGRRKEAIVRVRLLPGTGQFKLNGRTLEDYFPRAVLRQSIILPFTATETTDRYDVKVSVRGVGDATDDLHGKRIARARREGVAVERQLRARSGGGNEMGGTAGRLSGSSKGFSAGQGVVQSAGGVVDVPADVGGVAQGPAAGDGREILVAHLDDNGARVQVIFFQPASRVTRHLVELGRLPALAADGELAQAPVSRNAPCPCGSGRKYKHCHGQLA